MRKPITRRIEVLESSFIVDEQQRTTPPALHVRRLSQNDWPSLSAYALPSTHSASLSSRRSNLYEL